MGVMLVQEPIGGGGQVVHNDGGAEVGCAVALGLGAVAGAHEDTPVNACIPAAFEVNHFVSDHIRGSKVYAKFVSSIKQELG